MSFLTLWAWFALVAVAAPLSGTVVDQEGKPVNGAAVWLTSRERFGADVEELAHVETDAGGGFTIDVSASRERPSPLTLWAYAPGARVAISSLEERPNHNKGPLRLTLGPPARTSVRVIGSDGKAVAGAKIRPTALVWPASLLDRIEATTDAQGRAAIEGVGPGQVFRLDVTTDGLGTQGHTVSEELAEKTVRLLPVGRISARLVSDDPKALAGWTVTASTRPDEAGGPGWPTSQVNGQSDESGRVTLRPLAAGRATFRVVPPEGSPFLGVPPGQVALRDGESVEVKVPVKKAVKVEGSVREHGSGKPAAGVKVNLFRLGPGSRNEAVVTDAEGRFSRYVLPGKLRVYLVWFELPDRYYMPASTIRPDDELAVGEDTHTLAPLEVWPATVLKGVVVDEAGKPVAGVQVVGSGITKEFGDQPIPGSTSTDERGAFVLGHMPPDSTVKVRGIHFYRAEAPEVMVRVNADGVQDAPITLRLVRKPTVSLRGRVLGPGGLPVSGAQVKIVFRKGNEQNVYGNYEGEQLQTGLDGTFRTPDGVPVADQYRASVMAAGMEPALSDWAKAPAVELPDVVLRRVSRLRQVAGRVIDPDGKAVAGAEVFQSGDGPRRTSDTTDGEGRFSVPEVFDTPAFVFVKKDGFRFTGRRVGAGNEPVEIVVSRGDGPAPPALKPVSPPMTRADERAKARALVAPVWKKFKPGQVESPGPFVTAPTLALVDTARVVEMVENQILHADGPLLANIALGLYEESPRDAVETLDALRPPSSSAEALLDLFDQVPDAPADLRRDLLTRALARAREGGDPEQRLALTARVADRWFDAGEPGKARALVDEARAAFKGLSSGASLALRGDFAEALARVDLTAALALLEGGKNEERRAVGTETKTIMVQTHDPLEGGRNEARLAEIARRIAATDPAGADRVFGRVKQRPVRLNALADVCAGMAATDLPRALDLAGPGAPGVAALSVAAAAQGKATADPAGAKAMLADSFDRLEPLSGKMVVPAVAMARLLPLAVRVDPGRSSEYLWRPAMAARPRASRLGPWSASPEIRRQYLVLAELAALVARYDREAAEMVFAPVAENASALIDDRFGLVPEAGAILEAAAVFDPRAAMAMLDALPDDPEPPTDARPGMPPRFTPHTKETARLAVARALALPPALRRREALRIPGQPDLWPAVLDDGFNHPRDARTLP